MRFRALRDVRQYDIVVELVGRVSGDCEAEPCPVRVLASAHFPDSRPRPLQRPLPVGDVPHPGFDAPWSFLSLFQVTHRLVSPWCQRTPGRNGTSHLGSLVEWW